jgi:hypothetical protein
MSLFRTHIHSMLLVSPSELHFYSPNRLSTLPHSPRLRQRPTGVFSNKRESVLQSVGKELVHLGHLGRDADVDGSVANLDDQPANDVGVNLSR